MTEDHRNDRDWRSLWEGESAPETFAERVSQHWAEELRSGATDPSGHESDLGQRWQNFWNWPKASLALSVAAALVLSWWLMGQSRAFEGGGRFHERTTLDLQHRGRIVAEAHSEVFWQVAHNGRAKVLHTKGRAFYRVDPGPAYEVETPLGVVRVLGTCFTVEIEDMTNTRMGFVKRTVLPSLTSMAVVITVYEGRVDVAHAQEGSNMALEAGQRARLTPDAAAPMQLLESSSKSAQASHGRTRTTRGQGDEPAAKSEVQRLKETNQRLRAENQMLRGRARSQHRDEGIDELKPEAASADQSRTHLCAVRPGADCAYLEPDAATLHEMARCKTVRSDIPDFLYSGRDPRGWIDRFPPDARINKNEIERIAAVSEAFRDAHLNELRTLYVELGGGSPEEASRLPDSALTAALDGLADQDEQEEVRQQVALERAGLRDKPSAEQKLSPSARFIRVRSDIGQLYEAALAAELGEHRARELRRSTDGWQGGRSVYGGACADEMPSAK